MKRKFYTRLDFKITLTIGLTLFVVFAFSSYGLITIFTKNEILSLQVYAAKKYGIKLKRPIDIGPIFAPFSKR